ncbi:MAG: hypothetical protein ACREV7_15155 [Steroidobacteraceae bacterium]
MSVVSSDRRDVRSRIGLVIAGAVTVAFPEGRVIEMRAGDLLGADHYAS